ncbi:tubulin-tyrosine ligase family protein (macronuclear) [Tetrahymena thermophila SB210]|uniref:Tubulin--tyrosine ligase-like protein 9 n=1 Tax=Tetrahymena thermophila (strain SB210) TaxID=312017 RepID=Q24DM2_TETTS|nr:tubulin-tyrosine ligase family protein [Tetrahymena thermophila SB210]EAS05891.1 tubulin-tyrosine ligase family protein [Tetrahymena thermophila SB210]|eukprot:XP_001026136.1 tubulin-tyrosine ligase family protein [Tetrahymena thermophila SB210]
MESINYPQILRIIVLLILVLFQRLVNCQSTSIVKIETSEEHQSQSIDFEKFNSCQISSTCDDFESCKAQVSYCRYVYCYESKKKLVKNQDQMLNKHANCVEFCINKFFTSSFGNEITQYFECLYSKNVKDGFFINNGFKSMHNYFGSYKPKILIGESAIGVSQLIEEFFINKQLELVYKFDQDVFTNNSKGESYNIYLKWDIEDHIIETEEHCNFVKYSQEQQQKMHFNQLYQISHPIAFSQLLTRKDCLKKILDDFDQLLSQSCIDQDEENKLEVSDKKCIMAFSSNNFLLKSYYIDTKNSHIQKSDDSQKIIDGNLKQNVKYVLKPAKSNYGSGLKFVRNFEEFRKQFMSMIQKNQKLVYKEYILEEFLENQLMIDEKRNIDISFYVSVLSTNPQLVYAKKGYVRVNGYQFDLASQLSQSSNSIFNSRYYEVLKSGEMKSMEVENYFYTFDEFFEIIKKNNQFTQLQFESIIQKCLAIITYTFQAYMHQASQQDSDTNLLGNISKFSILRFDFLLNNKMKPFLIEVEGNPLSGEYTQANPSDLNQLLEDVVEYAYQLNANTIHPKDLNKTIQDRKNFIANHPFEDKNPQYIPLVNDAIDFLYITDVFEL